jgi:hypothetical protein
VKYEPLSNLAGKALDTADEATLIDEVGGLSFATLATADCTFEQSWMC